jgi:saccharopine dehydrogenase (NADP+, L-glutamate forming)
MNILVLGAGLSSGYLIEYLAKAVQNFEGTLTVADISLEAAQKKIEACPFVTAQKFDIQNITEAESIINQANIVVSLVPAIFQGQVAQLCLKLGKHFLSASYLPAEVCALDTEVQAKGLLFLNELGLDPGIDHLSAMQLLDEIRAKGGEIISFKSFCGALIAPESDTNPWHYKFTWNPRNVVLAGQGGTARFLENGQFRYIPFYQLFNRIEMIEVEGFGKFEGYANRDSLGYRIPYGLENIPTMLRGTLRKGGFCAAWNALVQLGMTDNSFEMENVDSLTYRQFTASFLYPETNENLSVRVARQLGIAESGEIMQKLAWLDLFTDRPIMLSRGTPAQVLQHILEEKWKLGEDDKDIVVMQHQIGYVLDGKNHQLTSELAVVGDSPAQTAIAKTVGLPLAMATRLLAEGKLKLRGVQIPVQRELYEPILAELKEWGIAFKEKTLTKDI